jgi:hypothetical protein
VTTAMNIRVPYKHRIYGPAESNDKNGSVDIRGFIQKFPDWPPGTSTANGTALCH